MAENPIRPQDQTNYLLGELSGKMTALQQSIEAQSSAQAQVNSELRADVNRALTTAAEAHNGIDVLRASIPSRTPWWQIVGGLSGILAIIVAGVALLGKLV